MLSSALYQLLNFTTFCGHALQSSLVYKPRALLQRLLEWILWMQSDPGPQPWVQKCLPQLPPACGKQIKGFFSLVVHHLQHKV